MMEPMLVMAMKKLTRKVVKSLFSMLQKRRMPSLNILIGIRMEMEMMLKMLKKL